MENLDPVRVMFFALAVLFFFISAILLLFWHKRGTAVREQKEKIEALEGPVVWDGNPFGKGNLLEELSHATIIPPFLRELVGLLAAKGSSIGIFTIEEWLKKLLDKNKSYPLRPAKIIILCNIIAALVSHLEKESKAANPAEWEATLRKILHDLAEFIKKTSFNPSEVDRLHNMTFKFFRDAEIKCREITAGEGATIGKPPAAIEEPPKPPCHQCGTKVEPGDKYCSHCGVELDSSEAPPPTPTPSQVEERGFKLVDDEKAEPPAPAMVLGKKWNLLPPIQKRVAEKYGFTSKKWNGGLPVSEEWAKLWAIPFLGLSVTDVDNVTKLGFTAENWGKPLAADPPPAAESAPPPNPNPADDSVHANDCEFCGHPVDRTTGDCPNCGVKK